MQLKKMREILPIFYASQVNKEHHSLTSSPEQGSVDKANPAATKNKNQNCNYQKTEEIKSNRITCIKSKCVQETSALELWRQTCQQGGDNCYVCNKYMLSVPSINFVTDPSSVFNTENKGKQSSSKILKTFMVKNIQPDKYYCDKCRFSTKDPLQYKKHITQHEEIKFVCSYCGCVSYTKGEFQRHLVKHTGKFPYQCQYCDYGAIRNDYIVKHIKRLHKTIVDNLVKVPVENAKQNTSCWSKQNSVKKRLAQEAPLQNKSSNESFSTSQDETPEIVCMSSSAECSQGIAFIQDKNRVEPSAFGIHENENSVVEVEVYSPRKEPIMPEMPLTVVAPAKFVVPPNCLAEIVEVKNMNGVRRLILKLLPVKEITSRPAECQAAEHVNQCTDQGEKTISLSPTLDDTRVLDNEFYNDFGSVVSPSSAALNCNSVNLHKKNVICKGNEEREKNFTEALAELLPDQNNSEELTSRWKYGKHRYLHFDFSSFKCLTPLSCEGGNVLQNSWLDTIQENHSVSPSPGFDTKRFTLSNAERGHCNKLPVTKTHSIDSSHSLESHAELQRNTSLCLDRSKNVIATGNEKDMKSQKEHISMDSFEVQNVKTEGESSEGPVILSVFSLSSGAANIPEGIQWDDMLPKKSSAALLCRKIAQLMSAAESGMKSQLATSLRHDKSPSKEKELLYPEAPAKFERSSSTTELEPDPVSSPQGSSDAGSSKDEDSNRGECAPPLEAPKRARAKKRMVNKAHASPVFIPPGTVLRVFDCIRTKGLANEPLPSPVLFCSDTFLPRPASCCVSENCIQTSSSLYTENGVTNPSRNQGVSHWHGKKRKGKKRKHIRKNKHSRLLPYPKGSEINTPSKGEMKGKKNKKKGKQANAGKKLTKKRPSNQDDCYIIKVEPVLTRRLQLIPFKSDQLIKCPHRNQPVIVLNHPDVDPPEIINVMKVINKYKVNVVKAVLSERTILCLRAKRYHKRLMYQNFVRVTQMEKLNALKMKLKKIHRNAYKVVDSSPAEASEQTFQCWFCGRTYVDQEEWISHGQKHLMEATRGWEVPSDPLESDEEEICVD